MKFDMQSEPYRIAMAIAYMHRGTNVIVQDVATSAEAALIATWVIDVPPINGVHITIVGAHRRPGFLSVGWHNCPAHDNDQVQGFTSAEEVIAKVALLTNALPPTVAELGEAMRAAHPPLANKGLN